MNFCYVVPCKQKQAIWEPMLVDKSWRDMIKFRNLKNHSGRVMVVLCCIVCTKLCYKSYQFEFKRKKEGKIENK